MGEKQRGNEKKFMAGYFCGSVVVACDLIRILAMPQIKAPVETVNLSETSACEVCRS